tara:strand:+ start:714 stop:1751 length:1038 start_codon:yes stop_codon:yes gene_type:complete
MSAAQQDPNAAANPTTTGDVNNAQQPVPGLTGTQTGSESTLSNWAGEYVTDMLGKGRALSETPYEAYQGPLTAGASGLQSQAFQGAGNLQIPQAGMGTFTPQSYTDEGVAQQYMNPFLEQMLTPQLAELQRQADRLRIEQAGRLTNAGAYGGGRQAVMESELNRNLLDEMSQLTGQAYTSAYDRGATQFNNEQQRGIAAQNLTNKYGFDVLQRLEDLGLTQRNIEGQGIEADRAEFDKELQFPYQQVNYQRSLLQGLPVASKDYTYTEPSQLAQLLSTTQGASSAINDIFGAGTVSGVTSGVGDFISDLFGGSDPNQFESGYNSAGQMVDYFRAGGIVNSGRDIK